MFRKVKSLFSLLLAVLPFFVLGYCRNSVDLEKYKELFFVLSLPGILYFLKFEILAPLIRNEITKPLLRIVATATRAMKGKKDALRKLEVLETLD